MLIYAFVPFSVANPVFQPEVSGLCTVVNFAVKEKGLEDQLLGFLVKLEEPKLEQDKQDLTVAVAAGTRRLAELEDEVLDLLKKAGGNILDDETLIEALQSSKVTAETCKSQLKVCIS